MRTKRLGQNHGIRYSEAFKLAVVREVEEEDLPFEQVRRKYGIKGCETVQKWVRRYGDGTRGKVIRVQTPREIDQAKESRKRVRQLEQAVANLTVDLAIERAYTKLACERAGVAVEEFKKKADGQLPMKR